MVLREGDNRRNPEREGKGCRSWEGGRLILLRKGGGEEKDLREGELKKKKKGAGGWSRGGHVVGDREERLSEREEGGFRPEVGKRDKGCGAAPKEK